MSNYYDGLNQKLLAAIPIDAKRVLELGCANGRLGQRFKELHPDTQWVGIEVNEQAAAAASKVLDGVLRLDLNQADLSAAGQGFDVIVIGDLLEHLRSPEAVLSALYDLSAPRAKIVCCLPNMGHLSVIERLVAGDISYDDMGLLDKTHSRFFSASSAFKTFLDGGWLPHLQDQYRVDVTPCAFTNHILQAAMALGLPQNTASFNMGLYQMILVCEKWPMQFLAKPSASERFSVIVPVNRPWQFNLNIARSPGLKEVGAEVIPLQGASSAAEAYAIGASKAAHPWRLMVHQDVYFPTGTGFALAQSLGALTQGGVTALPIGFAGLAGATDGSVSYAGQVVDRTRLFSHGPSHAAVCMDELAVVLHRDAAVRLDPSLGWHLWATDLCLQIQQVAQQPVAQLLEIPIFHNSTNDYNLPAAFHESARRLLEKYPHLAKIPTLCGLIERRAQGLDAKPAFA